MVVESSLKGPLTHLRTTFRKPPKCEMIERIWEKLKTIDLFTDTAAILNSIVLTEKLWAAEGAIAGKFILYTAFRINFYCLSLIFHNKYYRRYIFPSRYLAVVSMVIEKNYC